MFRITNFTIIKVLFFEIFLVALIGYGYYKYLTPGAVEPLEKDDEENDSIFHNFHQNAPNGTDPSRFTGVVRYGLFRPGAILISEDSQFFFAGTGDGFLYKVNIATGEKEEVLSPGRFHVVDEKRIPIDEERCRRNPSLLRHCGRVMGLNYDLQGKLLIANANLGIFRYDLKGGTLESLVNPYVHACVLCTDVLQSQYNNEIYFSDMGHHSHNSVLYEYIENGKYGHVKRVNLKRKQSLPLPSPFVTPTSLTTVNIHPFNVYLYVTEATGFYTSLIDSSHKKHKDSQGIGDLPYLPTNIFFHPTDGDVQDVNVYVTGLLPTRFLVFLMREIVWTKVLTRFPRWIHYPILEWFLFKKGGVIARFGFNDGGVKEVIYDEGGKFMQKATVLQKLGDRFFVGSQFVDDVVSFEIKN